MDKPLLLLLLLLLLPFLLTACSAPAPYRGGTAFTTPLPSGALAQSLTQSDNPSQPSRQSQHTIRTRTWSQPATVPASVGTGATAVGPIPPLPSDGRGERGEGSIQYPASGIQHLVLLSEREESQATTELGAAQKDTSRDLAAKLASLKPITLAGLAFFLFGLASLFWPPLKLIVASVTTSLALTVGGLALIILPTLLVGHELPILLAVTLVSAAWFLAHRHGHLRGQLTRSAAVPAAGSPKRSSRSM